MKPYTQKQTTFMRIAAIVLCAVFALSLSLAVPVLALADEAGSSSSSSSPLTTGADTSTSKSQTTATTGNSKTKKSALPTGLKKGWNKIKGSWYLGNKKGKALTGWQTVNGVRYYFDKKTGKMLTGWQTITKKKYYFAKSGAVTLGWKKITYKGAKKWFYFNKKGAMVTGWKKLKGVWYYLQPKTGVMLTGWQKLPWDGSKRWYYFYKSGAMARNAYMGKYYLGSSGAWSKDPLLKRANKLYSATNNVIVVDTNINWVCVYKGTKGNRSLVRAMQCTSGAPATPTVKGEFSVLDRIPFFGDGSYVVWNATRFYGDYFFHSVLYYPGSTTNIQDGRLGKNLSHGCVRLSYADSAWIYNTINNGTKVLVL